MLETHCPEPKDNKDDRREPALLWLQGLESLCSESSSEGTLSHWVWDQPIPAWHGNHQSVEKEKGHSASLAPQCLLNLKVEHQALTVRRETMSWALTVKLAETL